MHTLVNETPNEHIRNMLEELTCYLNESERVEGVSPLTSQDKVQRPHYSSRSKADNDLDEQSDEDYEEETGSQRHLLDIPVGSLPCPEAVRVATDSPLTADSRHEGVHSQGSSNQPLWATPLLLLLLAHLLRSWTALFHISERLDWYVDWLTCIILLT